MYDMQDVHWRWNREPTLAGMPAPALLPVFLSLYIRSMDYFYLACFVIIFYSILNKLGFTISAMYNRLLHILRGKNISARPYWYRKRFQGE